MRRILLVTFAFIVLYPVSAQDEEEYHTILGDAKPYISGFGGPIMSFTQIDGQFSHMMGGGGGLIVNDVFLGVYGIGKTTSYDFPNDASSNMEFGHGGFWVGYTHNRGKAVHPVFHTQIGWGAISKSPKDYENYETEVIDGFFIVTPAIELEFNFSRVFKLGAGVNYTYVYGVDNIFFTNQDFNHIGAFLSFKFGWFK